MQMIKDQERREKTCMLKIHCLDLLKYDIEDVKSISFFSKNLRGEKSQYHSDTKVCTCHHGHHHLIRWLEKPVWSQRSFCLTHQESATSATSQKWLLNHRCHTCPFSWTCLQNINGYWKDKSIVTLSLRVNIKLPKLDLPTTRRAWAVRQTAAWADRHVEQPMDDVSRRAQVIL